MNAFMEKPQAKKGAIGEAIIDELLAGRGWVPYKPAVDRQHPFDRLVTAPDGSQILIADVKAKPKRKHYPDTGINTSHHQKYRAVAEQHSVRVFLFFVDDKEAAIYGQFLHVLDRPKVITHKARRIEYPLVANGVRYYPRASMTTLRHLNPEEVRALKRFSTHNPAYDEDAA